MAKAKKDDTVQPDTLPTTDATTPVLPEPNPELEQLKGENARLQAELEQLKAENSDLIEQCNQRDHAHNVLAADLLKLKVQTSAPTQPPQPGAGSTRARVTVPNTHFGSIDVDIPADAANPHTAAIEAAKQARGVVSFGAGPQVEFLN